MARAATTLAAVCAVGAAVPAVASAGLTVSVTTASPKDVATTSATMRATILLTVLGGTVDFQYGPTAAYGQTSAGVDTGLLGAAQNVTVPVTGLAPSTTYHVRAAVVAGLGSTYGADVTFTTAAASSSGSGSSGGSGDSGSSGSNGSGDSGSSGGSGSSGSGSSGSSGSSGKGPSGSDGPGKGPSSGPAAPGSPKSPSTPGAPKPGAGAAPAAGPSSATPSVTLAPTPALGRTVGLEAVAGAVTATAPSGATVDLSTATALPTGTVVDARKGTVELTAALDRKGTTQTGRFWGGVFEVRQTASAKGLTQIILRGPSATSCAARAAGLAHAAKATTKKKKAAPPRSLWGKDDHGRFQTRGQGSVATVRGTEWFTQDTCAGTLTRVAKGAVSVYDLRRKRAVLVTHGHEYLARTAAR